MDDTKMDGEINLFKTTGRENLPPKNSTFLSGYFFVTIDAIRKVKRPGLIPRVRGFFTPYLQLAMINGLMCFSKAAYGSSESVTVEEAPSATVLPAPASFSVLYSASDIGSVGAPGTSAYEPSAGIFTVTGAGNDIAGLRDSFQFAWAPVREDFEMIARVTSFSTSDSGAKAGVMMRESLAPNAAEVSIVVTPVRSVIFLRRASSGAATSSTTIQSVSLPILLRLRRENNIISAYYSSHGASWASMGSVDIGSLTSGLAGLAVTSKANSSLATAQFDSTNLITGISLSTLGGLTLYNVGTVKLAASAELVTSNGVISLTGSGYRFPNASKEGCAYLARRSSDNLAISTRILAARAGLLPARAGLMMRDSPSDDSAQVTLALNNTGNVVFEYRNSAGAPLVTRTYVTGGREILLDRRGSSFTAMVCADGITFLTLGTATISLRADALAGLITTSMEQGSAVSADFEAFDLLP